MWWVTISEIFNYKKLLYFDINETVVNYFKNNPTIMQLFYNNMLLETPIICYHGNHSKMIAYISIFGIKKAGITSRFGPYYYFTDFNNSMRYGCYNIALNNQILEDGTKITINENGKYDKGGIVRFVIFSGKMKVFMKNDKNDESNMSKFLSDKNEFDRKTQQFRDCDGKWTDKYDCAYNGEYDIKMDNGDIKKLDIRWCIHDYKNQIPLSFHMIDIKSVPDKYNKYYNNYKIE